jgi:2-polyprenyl-6-methoxyphenol hydroxylase-like FAD-dependent oxidoreductase
VTVPIDPGASEVAIVGCGPVGMVLAILLGQQGRSVTVLERWPEPYPLPRAVHFDHEVGRILQACGVADGVRALSEPAEVYEWRNGRGDTLLRFGRIGPGRSGWPQSSMFCQPEFEALLEERARALPGVEVHRGVHVTTLEQLDDHVVLGDAGGGTVRARYAVGCDGANSTVRELAGIAMVDLGFFHDWLIVDLVLAEPRVFDPVNVQICDPTRPTTVVSGGPGRRRWEFMRLPHETLDDLNAEARAWELLAPWDVRPDNARLERHAVYRFQARYAERWRTGRVLLAGDAAHLMPPFAGQGMCAGIRDAANLAWKLDLVLTGRAPDALLDTYEQERLPSARAAIRFSMELGQVICVADPAEAAARDAAMGAAVTGELTEVADLPGIGAGFVHADDPLAGELFVQPSVDGVLFDEVHGAGWRLITTDGDPGDLDPAAVSWFGSIGGAVVALAEPGERAATWFAEHGAPWALQRPDFHLYGTATTAAGASDLLARLEQHLLAPAPTSGAPT